MTSGLSFANRDLIIHDACPVMIVTGAATIQVTQCQEQNNFTFPFKDNNKKIYNFFFFFFLKLYLWSSLGNKKQQFNDAEG